jgi:dipeptidyl-peptidase-4
VAVDEAKHLVYFTATEGSPIAPGLWVTDWDGGAPRKLSGERGTHRIAFDTRARFYVDAFSTVATPPGSWVRGVDGTLVAELAAPTAKLAPYELQHPEFSFIPAADGYPLPARLYRPRDFDPTRRYPVVIHVYGGPGAPQVNDAWDRDVFWVNMLLDRGFVYASIDNRCATGLSKTLEDTVYGKFMAGPEADDIAAAARWLKAQPWVDGAHVGVWGWSGGGTLTLQLLTHSTEFAAGIAGAAVTDFRYYDSKIPEAYLGLPQEAPDAYVASAAAASAGKLSGRLLLIHGGLDDNVQPQNAWRFAHELQKAGITFDMMIYPTEKHGVTSRDGRVHLHKTMLEFWERWLK